MRIRSSILLLLLLPLVGSAQQIAQYTQYVFNQFAINPAVAGSADCLDLRLGYRQQWVGLPGAPTTGWVTMHGVIRAKGKPFQANKHGVGLFVEADDAGNLGYTGFHLAYAYHIQMSRNFFTSVGLFAGMRQIKLAVGDITLQDYSDDAVNSKAAAIIAPDIAPGVWVYGKRGWAGVSIHQVLGNKFKNVGAGNSRFARHLMLSAGYRYKVGRKTIFIPTGLLKFAAGAPPAFDVNGMIEWNKVLTLGVGYRAGDAFTALLKIGFLKFFQLGYSYDITTSKLRVASSNTHELILAITPCRKGSASKRMISCPAFE